MLGFFSKRKFDFGTAATTEDGLKRISAAVDGLCIDLPGELFDIEGNLVSSFYPAGRLLTLVLTDQSEIYQKNWVSEFRLEVAGVSECRAKFEDNVCGEDTIDTVKFRTRDNLVVIQCIGCTLSCRVDGLMVKLEKVA